MQKLHCKICDRCNKVLDESTMITVKGKKRDLHYCSEECRDKHLSKKHIRDERRQGHFTKEELRKLMECIAAPWLDKAYN